VTTAITDQTSSPLPTTRPIIAGFSDVLAKFGSYLKTVNNYQTNIKQY
jgi:hypothetical protein